jgi:hypothetical protein
MKDGIHRAMLRGDSLYMRAKVVAAAELLRGAPLVEAGKKRLIETRQRVKAGWLAVSDTLIRQGQSFFASESDASLMRCRTCELTQNELPKRSRTWRVPDRLLRLELGLVIEKPVERAGRCFLEKAH